MKQFVQEDDLNELIVALSDNIHFFPETPSIRPSAAEFIEFDGMQFSLDGRKDSMNSNDSDLLDESPSTSPTKREKRIKKLKRAPRKSSSAQIHHF